MKIVQSCSYAVESTENFQCIRLVDSQEQRRQFESWHLDLQLRPYHNFAFDAKQVNPIFGVPSTPEFVVSLLDKVQKKEGSISLPAVHPQILKRAGFELEERCIHESRETIIENESVENIKHYIWFGLLSGPPVIPLKDEHVKRFSSRDLLLQVAETRSYHRKEHSHGFGWVISFNYIIIHLPPAFSDTCSTDVQS